MHLQCAHLSSTSDRLTHTHFFEYTSLPFLLLFLSLPEFVYNGVSYSVWPSAVSAQDPCQFCTIVATGLHVITTGPMMIVTTVRVLVMVLLRILDTDTISMSFM